MTGQDMLLRLIELSLASYFIHRVVTWHRRGNSLLNRAKKLKDATTPTKKVLGLYQQYNKDEQVLEARLGKNAQVLNVKAGFCDKHPKETRLVMNGRKNECYTCLAAAKK